ncbi:ubiquitin carboxyl-terminal hydrolase 2-like isoform X2 [Silene latifolia]
MGKRVRKKAQGGLKEKRVSTSSPKVVLKEINQTSKIFNEGVMVVKKRKVCPHFDKAVDVAKVCSKLESAESTSCEDCQEGIIDRKGGRGKGKHGKKKCESRATWICLQCGRFSCGGVDLPNTEQTHALRHSCQSRHPLVIQMENNNLRWCFSCRTLIPVETLDDNGVQIDALSDIVKILKNQSSKTTSVDMEDKWLGSGSVISDVKSENKLVSFPNGKDLFVIRGLVNLGNTCFFNSVMQNLLAIDILREYLLSFDGSMGPMTSALKEIYIETSLESGLRNVINPEPLFGCICANASQFKGYQQQDSHEFLRCLLDGLSAEDLCAKKSDICSRENGPSLPASPTFIDDIFGGQISSTVCCVECGHSLVIHEPFLDLSLPLPTKKPHAKKVPPASRKRKAKQPPKTVGRPRPKLKKDGNLRSTVIGCDHSSSSQSSSADLVEPGLVVDNKALGSQEHNSTQPDDASTQVPESGGQEVDVLQLDYPEPVTQSDAQEAGSCLDDLEPATQSYAQEPDSWLNYPEPVSLSDDQNLTVESNDVLDSVESGSKDGNHTIHSFQKTMNSSEQIGVDTGEKNVKPQSVVDGWEDDCLMQVKDNEVLLLPYKKDCPSTEIPSLAVGDEEHTSDFVGFGDMFDEAEAVATPSEVSNNMEGSSHLGNGFLAGNSTESDPDEVDNTDSLVSVKSCLAHFVKPELLSGEHAWHCENCSKLQLKERQKLKKNRRRSSLLLQKNMAKNEYSGSNSVLVADSNESSGPHENLKIRVPLQANGSTPALSKELGERYEPVSACSDATNVSICPQLPDEASPGSKSINCCIAYADHVPVERLSGSEKHDSEEDEEDDDIDSKSVKVMRSAIKRILISKSPPILTIHLKRFEQDARGRLSKLSGHVVFKEFIDLRPYLDNRSVRDKCIYRLIGVVEHSGSMRSGHYVAYVRGTDTGQGSLEEKNDTKRHNVWYHASDSYVRETTLNEVLHSEAYILFYEKVHLEG